MADPNDEREIAREQYKRTMLGVGRPHTASKRAQRMVDGLVGSYQATIHRPGDHTEGVFKQRHKALLRYIGKLEHDDAEAALYRELVENVEVLLEFLGGEPGDWGESRIRTIIKQIKEIEDAKGA